MTERFCIQEEKLGVDKNAQPAKPGKGQIWDMREGKRVNTPLCTRGLILEIKKKLQGEESLLINKGDESWKRCRASKNVYLCETDRIAFGHLN